MKICTTCLIPKPFNNFCKRLTGLSYVCRACSAVYKKANKENRRLWRLKNKNKIAAQVKAYAKAHPEMTKVSFTKYQRNNLPVFAAHAAKRHATKLNATPLWLTKEQINEIKQFYVLANELSWLSESPLQVDHIIPLQGENVTGLHVPWNLQILPRSMNITKSNKV